MSILLFFNDVSTFSSPYLRFESTFKLIQSVKWLNVLCWVIVVFCEGLYLNFLVNKFKIVNQNSHFPLALFVLFNGFSAQGLQLNQVHVLNLLILLAFHQLFLIYNEQKTSFQLFNAAFFIGIGTVFYLPFGALMGLLWFIIRYIKPFYWKEYIVSIIGFLTPLLYVAFYYFMIDDFSIDIILKIIKSPENKVIETNNLSWHYIIFMLLLAIFSFFFTFFHIQHLVVKIRKFLTIFLLLFLLILSMLLIVEPISRSNYVIYQFLLIPLSIFVSLVFVELKKQRIAELIFYLLIIMVIGNYLPNP